MQESQRFYAVFILMKADLQNMIMMYRQMYLGPDPKTHFGGPRGIRVKHPSAIIQAPSIKGQQLQLFSHNCLYMAVGSREMFYQRLLKMVSKIFISPLWLMLHLMPFCTVLGLRSPQQW